MTIDKESWYSLRNDRIDRMIGTSLSGVQKRPVGVIIGHEGIHQYSNQVMAVLVLNMMARWCPHIIIEIPKDIPCVILNKEDNTLNTLVTKIVDEADPFGTFIFDKVERDEVEHVINIGKVESTGDYLWIDADGWVAGYGYGKQHSLAKKKTSKNPIGPSMAACIGVSALFKVYLGLNTIESFSKWYSLYDFSSSDRPDALPNPIVPGTLDIGRVFQVGCGAVGSSLDFLLSLIDIKGNLHLIDFDKVKIPNTASSLVFTTREAEDKIKKVTACNRILDNNQLLEVHDHYVDYGEHIKNCDYENKHPDLILCLANERNIWSSIQYNQPPTVLHATTTKNWGINFGRHIPEKEWCIVCCFGIQEYQFTPHCAEVVSPQQKNAEILGTLPFLSPLAAVLVLAEMIKSRSGLNYPVNKNFIQFSTKITEAVFSTMQMQPQKECIVCCR